jgi:ubiquinone/menaquinone biosynthesis C-methylase UbiE
MSSASFDSAAQQYDETFTNTEIGKLQRDRVWNYLESILPNQSINILELNCGTGEDAIWLAKKDHNILATDISDKMLSIAKMKIENLHLSKNIIVEQLDINKIHKFTAVNKFDLIFSNFGGLNCLTPIELNSLSNNFKNLLNPNGKFVAVVMSDFCMIESLYFLLKFKLNSVFRRKKMQQTNINDSIIDTYYYPPNGFYEHFKTNFKLNNTIAIGILIPPSYLNVFLENKKNLLNVLNLLETFFGNNSFSAKYSDHFLIDLNLNT